MSKRKRTPPPKLEFIVTDDRGTQVDMSEVEDAAVLPSVSQIIGPPPPISAKGVHGASCFCQACLDMLKNDADSFLYGDGPFTDFLESSAPPADDTQASEGAPGEVPASGGSNSPSVAPRDLQAPPVGRDQQVIGSRLRSGAWVCISASMAHNDGLADGEFALDDRRSEYGVFTVDYTEGYLKGQKLRNERLSSVELVSTEAVESGATDKLLAKYRLNQAEPE